jgi:hypothetical protein
MLGHSDGAGERVRGIDPKCSGTALGKRSQRGPGVVDGRQYALALEAFCALLVSKNKRIAPELYNRIHGLCRQLDGVDPYLIAGVRAIVRK